MLIFKIYSVFLYIEMISYPSFNSFNILSKFQIIDNK